jgi:CubicO group peptidase (beta-lactamase class C family)
MRKLLPISCLLLAGCATVQPPIDDPGVVAGVAFTLQGEVGSFVEGLADAATGRKATVDDPVRVASVSKLVVAIGVLRLVEQGRLDLDSDVSRWLGWSLRSPHHPDQAVSLRQLLSHTSGIRDHDDQYAIPLGGSVQATIGSGSSWDARHGPGANYFAYSNMNFPVVASVMERATGERFDRLMQRLVLRPLNLDACFNWSTCSDDAVARAVVLTQGGKPIRDELRARRPECPVFRRDGTACDLSRWRAGNNGALFAPQGGLRISVRDLARVGRMLLGNGELDGNRLLSRASVAQLLSTQWRFAGRNGATDRGFICSYGLATHQIGSGAHGCDDDPVGDRHRWVGHAGEAYGLPSGLWINPATGTGVAYYRTGLAADTAPGRSAFRKAEEQAFRRTVGMLPR